MDLATLQFPAIAAAGSFILYLFGSGGSGQDFLDKRFPQWPQGRAKTIASLVIYVGVGAFVGTILADPQDQRAALIAGWSWFGLLEGLKGK